MYSVRLLASPLGDEQGGTMCHGMLLVGACEPLARGLGGAGQDCNMCCLSAENVQGEVRGAFDLPCCLLGSFSHKGAIVHGSPNERKRKDQTGKPVKWVLIVVKATNIENKALPLG